MLWYIYRVSGIQLDWEIDAEYERRAVFVYKSVSSYQSQFTMLQKNYQVMLVHTLAYDVNSWLYA